MASASNHQRDIDTEAIERKTGAFSLSPDHIVKAKAGVLWAAAVTVVGCAITCTTYVVRMEGKVDQSLTATQELNTKLEKIAPEHAIMWDWYNRTASRVGPRQSQP